MDGSAFDNKTANNNGKGKDNGGKAKRPSSVLPALWRLLQVRYNGASDRRGGGLGLWFVCRLFFFPL